MSNLELFDRFFDDAAIFPPGSLPLEAAVQAHRLHHRGAHAPFVGPLVVGGHALPALERLTADLPPEALDLVMTTPLAEAAGAIASVRRNDALRLAGLEVALPSDLPVAGVMAALRGLEAVIPDAITCVEIPRDDRRRAIIEALAGTPYLAKFRTGGVEAELYPDEVELAGALLDVAHSGLPFKATAGLHHALRNTDSGTGFEQHGFLNLLVATDVALRAGSADEVAAALVDRDADRVVGNVHGLDPRVRTTFRSVGTCSISDPVHELVELGLLDPTMTDDLP